MLEKKENFKENMLQYALSKNNSTVDFKHTKKLTV